MPELSVGACTLTVGRNAPEPVPGERVEFYQWLAGAVTDRPVKVAPTPETLYITFEELRSQSSGIREHLSRALEKFASKRVLIVDLAENEYHLLREYLLWHVAELTRNWVGKAQRRTLIILLPGMPPSVSIFWIPFQSAGRGTGTGRLEVVAAGADAHSWDRKNSGLGPSFQAEYDRREAPTMESLRQKFRAKVVRRPGHYNFTGRHAPHCARFYFDIQHAAEEIGMYVVRWLQDTVTPALPQDMREQPLTLVTVEKEPDALAVAAAGAAARLNHRCLVLDPAELRQSDPLTGLVVLFFNVIHTGQTYRRVVDALQASGVRLVPHAFAVMVTDPAVRIDGPLALEVLSRPDRKKSRDHECEQCHVDLEYTPYRESRHGLRSYDAWKILLEATWAPEPYGPTSERHLLSQVPDLGSVFESYGAWMASKIIDLCRDRDFPPDVVFVCPDERRIDGLVAKFAVLLENRQVAVRVPREILENPDDEKMFADRRDEAWQRQLRHLGGGRNSKVVMLDEFRARGTTARAMLKVLRRFQVEPLAFIPVLDFSAQQDFDEVPTYPLYSINTGWSAQ